MVAAAAAGAHAACGTSKSADAPDASVGAEAGVDATVDSAADVAIDAGNDVDAAEAAMRDCQPTITLVDALGPDAEDICDYTVPCGLEHHQLTHVASSCVVAAEDLDGAVIDSPGFPYCHVLEGQGCSDGSFAAAPGAGVTFECVGCFGGAGRRPVGLLPARGIATSAIGAYFAEVAYLEEASIAAFERLARDLRTHGAPRALVNRALAGARDEVRHARAMTKIAKRFGATPPRARVRAYEARSLAAIARENAVEGCARETYGALLAAWQAEHATDAAIRRALKAIARDELRHAALSWEIAAWIETKLTPAQARAVRRARDRATIAVAELPPSARAAAGLPDSRRQRWLAEQMSRALISI